MQKNNLNSLPRELKNLVKDSVALLGEVIEEEGGKSLYKQVEKTRKLMTEYRKSSEQVRETQLKSTLREFKKLNREQQHKINCNLKQVVQF